MQNDKHVEKVHFLSEQFSISANLFLPENRKKTGVLFLHGGGIGSKERYIELQYFLSSHRFSSFAFDFRGVGESEGVFEQSSLSTRLVDALSAHEFFSNHIENIIVLGTSMGAHVGARLIQQRPTSGLVILYGAAYAEEAENKSFNQEFTRILRIPNSWVNSPVFDILKNYNKPVLIVYGKNDTVIPKKVQRQFKKVIKKSDTFVELSDASHIILKPSNKMEEKEKEKTFDLLIKFLSDIAT